MGVHIAWLRGPNPRTCANLVLLERREDSAEEQVRTYAFGAQG
jgi:hypothetical protein